jgi:hypothetical protein
MDANGVAPTPDRNYRIDAEARSRLPSGVDADALERLLQYFPTESRALHLEILSGQRALVDHDGQARDVTILTRISDPGMQALLEEVWQPHWARLSDAELAAARDGPPGLELARQRRADGPTG